MTSSDDSLSGALIGPPGTPPASTRLLVAYIDDCNRTVMMLGWLVTVRSMQQQFGTRERGGSRVAGP